MSCCVNSSEGFGELQIIGRKAESRRSPRRRVGRIRRSSSARSSLLPEKSLMRFWPYLLLLLGILPFLNKPYHIDDPVFLAVADQIRVDPTHPYDVSINWTDRPLRVGQFMGSPPLHSYYLALVRSFGPDKEWWMHLCMIPFALIGLHAIYRLSGGDLLCACFWISAPAVLVSATNLMPDISVAALTTLGAAFFFERRWVLSGCTLLLASLIRYNAAAVLPGLAFYAIVTRQWRSLTAVALPCAAIFAWVVLSKDVLEAGKSLTSADWLLGERLVATPIFLLGATIAPLSLVVVRLKRLEVVVALLCAMAAGYACGYADVGRTHVSIELIVILSGMGTFALVSHLLRAIRLWRTEGEPLDLSLWLWAFMALAIPLVYVQVSAKYMTVAAAPLALLTLRGSAISRRIAWAGVGVWFLLSFSLSAADMELASMYRRIALSKVRQGMWFTGHWGVQWYGMPMGGRPMTIEQRPAVGDTIMVLMQARLATLDYTDGLRRVEILETMAPSSRLPVRILNYEAAAGWYSQFWGLLPYSFSTVPLERMYIGRILEIDKMPHHTRYLGRPVERGAAPNDVR